MIVNIPKFDKRCELRGNTRPVSYVKIDPKDEFIVSSCSDGNIKVWDINNKVCVKTFMKYTVAEGLATLYKGQCCWSHDGKLLAIPHLNDISIIERESWNELYSLSNEINKSIEIISFSPNDYYILSSDQNSTLCLWNNHDKSLIKSIDIDAPRCTEIQWNPNRNEALIMDVDGKYGIYKDVIDSSTPLPYGKIKVIKEDEKKDEKIVDDEAKEDLEKNNISDIEDDVVEDLDIVEAAEKELEKKGELYNDEDNNNDGKTIVLDLGNIMTAVQKSFQPSSTPIEERRRYLCWNSIGSIVTRNEDYNNSIQITFNDLSQNRTIRITDQYGFTLGTLSDSAAFFATPCINQNDGIHKKPTSYK